MSPNVRAAMERLRRVKDGEAKTQVYPHHNPLEDGFVKVGHAEFSHYNDLVFMADVAMATLPGIAELERKAARWDECERRAGYPRYSDGEDYIIREVKWGDTFAAAIDAAIAEREGGNEE